MPIFEWHTPIDPLIPVDAVDRTNQRYCRAGTPVLSELYPSPDHLATAVLGFPSAVAWLDARFRGERTQEDIGRFQQQSAAVARQAVGGDAAAMRHPRERFERLFDQRSAGDVVEVGDQPEAAGVALVARIVKAGGAALVGFHRMYSGKVTPVGNRGRHFPRGPRDRRGPCTACRWMARLKHRMVHCGNRVSAPAAGPASG